MIDHLHKQVQHSNRAFPIEQGKGGRGSLFFGGGEGGVAKRKITGYSSYTFSLYEGRWMGYCYFHGYSL